MRILSLNINGVKSFINNGRVYNIEEFFNYEVLCFQETKCSIEDTYNLLSSVFPHKIFHNPSTYRKGYAGVVTLIDEEVFNSRVDQVVMPSLKGDLGTGRLVVTHFKDFILINVYTPNSGINQEYRKYWDNAFREEIGKLERGQDKPILVIGDLNVVRGKLDHHNYEAEFNTMPGLYDFELDGYNKLCEDCGMADLFRVKYPTTRAYSWFSYQGRSRYLNKGWRIDYALSSPTMDKLVTHVRLESQINASDHCPLIVHIKDN